MQPDIFPRIAIRCKNPQCCDRGRVLAETDGARLWFGDDAAYIAIHTRVWCPTCHMAQHWQPDTTLVDRYALLTAPLP